MKYKILNFGASMIMLLLLFSCNDNEDNLSFIGVKKVSHKTGENIAYFTIEVFENCREVVVTGANVSARQEVQDGKVDVILENLPEEEVCFVINTIDDQGRKSEDYYHFASIYGEKYNSTLNPRIPSTLDYDYEQNALILNYDYLSANHLYSVITYHNKLGEEVNDTLERDAKTIKLFDVDYSHNYKVISKYLPSKFVLSPFETGSVEKEWGDLIIKYDRTKVKPALLPNDKNGEYWGGSLPSLFDGIISNNSHFHNGGDPNALTFTIDLGAEVVVDKAVIWTRGSSLNQTSKRYDIYGHTDLADAVTTTPAEDLTGFEDEMNTKGWSKIGSRVVSDMSEHDPSLTVTCTANKKVRYLRFRCDRIWWENAPHFVISEIDLYINVTNSGKQ
ncbi:DUF4998 domain-containing protein [Saccharicrinis sp. GN24d3]|uniref:DUF4998 domain-containing protein n=1 Tax=Saccharicrinis sp. GN24d3 TaxID=3458416 RepID=UPI0040365095